MGMALVETSRSPRTFEVYLDGSPAGKIVREDDTKGYAAFVRDRYIHSGRDALECADRIREEAK